MYTLFLRVTGPSFSFIEVTVCVFFSKRNYILYNNERRIGAGYIYVPIYANIQIKSFVLVVDFLSLPECIIEFCLHRLLQVIKQLF